MKNPFRKTNTSGIWIAAIAITAVAAGTVAWLFFKKNQIEEADAHLNYPYVKNKGGKKKKARTDLHDLHTIIPQTHEEEH